jgi:hypothetical protein
MLKRLLVIVALSTLPAAVLADDTAPTDAPPGTPTATATPAPASANGLGPGTSNPAGGSNGDAGSLQPAGTSPLQSTTGDSTGLTAPNQNALQAPANSDAQLKVLMNEADGNPHQAGNSGANRWLWLGFTLLFALLAAGAAWFWRRRSAHRRPNPFAPVLGDPPPAPATATTNTESTEPAAGDPSDGEPPSSEIPTTNPEAEPRVASEAPASTPEPPVTTPAPKKSGKRKGKHGRRH